MTAPTDPLPLNVGLTEIYEHLDELYDRTVNVKDFGAVGDGVTDDWAAIRAALDSGAVRIYFPAVTASYYSTKCFNLKKKYILYGDHGHNAVTNNFSTIKFAAGSCGIIVHGATTNANDYGYSNVVEASTTGADGSIIFGLRLIGNSGASPIVDGVTHGVRLRARAQLSNLLIGGFAGNGIHIVASSDGAGFANEKTGNANSFLLYSVRVVDSFNGVYVEGDNVNAGVGILVDTENNAGWGIWDSSFLGCTWVGPHSSGNALGPYRHDSQNGPTAFVGAYSESGQPPSSFIRRSTILGGIHAAEVNGPVTDAANIIGHGIKEPTNGVRVGLVTVTAAGSGYTSNPTVTFAAPSGAATATATATIGAVDFLSGKVLKINITSGGAGYSSNPVVTIGGDGSGASATSVIHGGIVKSITVTNVGSGYTTAPITIAAPTEVVAIGSAYLNSTDGVGHVVVNDPGRGYTTAPIISFSGGGGSGAAATCNLGPLSTSASMNSPSDTDESYHAMHLYREDVNNTGTGWRAKMLASSGDFQLDFGNSFSPVKITGPNSSVNFGRSRVVKYGAYWPSGLWLGNGNSARNYSSASSIPTTGEYANGDFVYNTNISELGSASSKYIILGWSRLVTGTAHVLNTDWLEARCLTGN